MDRSKYDPNIPDDLVEQYEREFGFDPWETSSGLPDQITLRVTNPHFGYDADFQDGQVPLFILEGTVIAGEGDPEFSQWYTVGKGWEAESKGTRLVPEKGKTRTLNKQTNYAHLFNSLREAADKQGLITEIRRRGHPLEARLWDGLELYMEREEYNYTIDNEKREGSRLLVAGIEGGVVAEKTRGESRSERIRSAPEPTVDTPTDPSSDSDLSPRIKVALRKLAGTVKAAGGTHSTFAEQAFSDVDGVLDSVVAEDAVMDQGAGSIWAEA